MSEIQLKAGCGATSRQKSALNPKRLKGRAGIVTGAGLGIGQATAKAMDREVAGVIVSGINEAGAKRWSAGSISLAVKRWPPKPMCPKQMA
ncbi:MAG: hypothetical protein WC749_10300 [Dehalococcoidia bacterium]